jgi:uncharacterized protein (TIGR03437 family)
MAAPALLGQYANLIATSDGGSVYLQAHTGPVTNSWYVARADIAGPSVTPIDGPLADVDGASDILATSQTQWRYCGFAGSSCWLAAGCYGSFQLEGPGFNHDNSANGAQYRDTFIRLSRSGRYAWIDQTGCGYPVGPVPITPSLNGLYESDSLDLVSAKQKGQLANQRFGRRAITDLGQALTIAGAQLEWLDATGIHLIRNVFGAYEAVTDAQGNNVAYIDGPSGELHWVTGPDWMGAQDFDLGVTGSAPALTDDGSGLLFLAADDSLRLYVRATAEFRILGPGSYSAFTTAGGVVFAVTQGGSLVRIDLASGDESVWLDPFVQIDGVEAPDVVPNWCTYVCYGVTEYPKIVSPGMVVVLDGSALGTTGWSVRAAGLETPLLPLSDAGAWLQVPSSADASTKALEIFKPGLAISYQFQVQVRSPAVVCLATAHQDFSRIVTEDDPAIPGEAVHVFLTGLQGTEAVANGVANPTDHLIMVANPPPLYDPGALQVLFFGLAPGLIGLQQLDLLIVGTPAGNLFTPSGISSAFIPTYNCAAPAVAAP